MLLIFIQDIYSATYKKVNSGDIIMKTAHRHMHTHTDIHTCVQFCVTLHQRGSHTCLTTYSFVPLDQNTYSTLHAVSGARTISFTLSISYTFSFSIQFFFSISLFFPSLSLLINAVTKFTSTKYFIPTLRFKICYFCLFLNYRLEVK